MQNVKKPTWFPKPVFCAFKILIPEIEQVLRLYIENLAKLEDNVEGNADVSELDGAYMAPVDINQLRELQLGQFLCFSVINNVQSEFFIK